MSLSANLPQFKADLKADFIELLEGMTQGDDPNSVIDDYVDKLCDRIDEHVKTAIVIVPGQPNGTLQ